MWGAWILKKCSGMNFWKYFQILLNDWINWRLGRQPEKFHVIVVFAGFFILNLIRKDCTLRRGFSKIGTPWCFPSWSPQISPGYSRIHQRNNHCKQKEIMKTDLKSYLNLSYLKRGKFIYLKNEVSFCEEVNREKNFQGEKPVRVYRDMDKPCPCDLFRWY